ncbi:MAG: HAD hydrolase-like protein [Clostridiaceae bacterium]|jgi:phosphoglycolate phosphatase|nr:HAD hydrolase-like protein [Clostridiaceae bacterium]
MPITRQPQHKAAVFDLDGTLLNTLPSMVAACRETTDILDLPPFGEEAVRTFVGMGQRVLVDRMMAASGVEDKALIDRAQAIYKEIFPRLSTYKVEAFEGIEESLECLSAMGFKLAVMTNKLDRLTPGVLARVFPPHRFDDIRGSLPGVPLKPDPASTLEQLARLGADPATSFFIGDSDIDILTGRAAGMRTMAVSWGFQPLQKLEALSPDYLVHKPADITGLIRQSLERA